MAAAEAAVTIGPEVGDILTRFSAAQCVDDNRAAQQRIAQAKATAAQRLRDLARGGVAFSALPVVTVTQRQAETLVTETLKADQQLTTLHATCATAAEKVAKAQARVGDSSARCRLATTNYTIGRRRVRGARSGPSEGYCVILVIPIAQKCHAPLPGRLGALASIGLREPICSPTRILHSLSR